MHSSSLSHPSVDTACRNRKHALFLWGTSHPSPEERARPASSYDRQPLPQCVWSVPGVDAPRSHSNTLWSAPTAREDVAPHPPLYARWDSPMRIHWKNAGRSPLFSWLFSTITLSTRFAVLKIHNEADVGCAHAQCRNKHIFSLRSSL